MAGNRVADVASTANAYWLDVFVYSTNTSTWKVSPVEKTENIYGQVSGVTPFNYGFNTVGYRFTDTSSSAPNVNTAYCTFFVIIARKYYISGLSKHISMVMTECFRGQESG